MNFENLDLYPEIKKIFNEIYTDFVARYGTKHSDRIAKQLEQISKKVTKADLYEGALATANKEFGILYSKSYKLDAILKHELCHLFNDSYFDNKDETCLTFFPNKYKDFLEEKGVLEENYNKQQEEYKERWKDEPERLKYLLTDYDNYKENFTYGNGSQETEKWTEWFNTKINQRNMKNNFNYLEDGFYSKNFSSGSFYDYYIGIAEMVSKLIPEDKLIDMYMATPEYDTGFSYKDLIEMFDSEYAEALNEQEKQDYKYPYLKILSDTNQIENNARKNDKVARNAYQSCTETCFRAYFKKIKSIENYDEKTLEVLYEEIKDLQEVMIWNLDTSKMKELGYVQVLSQIQDTFKGMCISLNVDKPNNKIVQMQENIDYINNDKFTMVENGNKIAQELFGNESKEKNKFIDIGQYKANIGEDGIKGNLYNSVKALFGNEALNLLFEKYQNENISFLTDSKEENKLVRLFNKIEELDDNIQNEKTNMKILSIYDDIYGLYNEKINEQIITDENVALEFKRIFSGIVELEKNSLIKADTGKFPDSLEEVIKNYKEKEQQYEQFIKNATENKLEKELKERRSVTLTDEEIVKFAWRIPNEEIKTLNGYVLSIEDNREEIKDKINVQEKQKKLPHSIGKSTINLSTNKKDESYFRIQQDIEKCHEKIAQNRFEGNRNDSDDDSR